MPLVLAAQIGNEDVFNFLLDHGCDIEAKGNCEFDNETISKLWTWLTVIFLASILVDVPPLWVAAARGNLTIVKRLLSLGANVNSSTSTNSHPLRAACYDGHYDIVSVLLDHGADINMTNRHGHTSLMIAAFRNHLNVVQLLLTRKGIVRAPIWFELIWRHYSDINVNAASIKGNTAMHDAAEAGNLEILQELLKSGAGVCYDFFNTSQFVYCYIKICERDSKSFDLYNMDHIIWSTHFQNINSFFSGRAGRRRSHAFTTSSTLWKRQYYSIFWKWEIHWSCETWNCI